MALVLFLIECREEADFRRKGEGDKKKKKYTGVKMMVLRQQGMMGKLSFFNSYGYLTVQCFVLSAGTFLGGRLKTYLPVSMTHDTRHIVILHKNVDFTVKSSCSDAKKHTDHFSHETCSDMT